MGLKKLPMKKINNPSSLHVTYSKRRDGLIKLASELSVSCDIDVGLLIFSPSGRFMCFASTGRAQSAEKCSSGKDEQAELLKQIAPAEPAGVKSPAADMNDTEVITEECGPSEGQIILGFDSSTSLLLSANCLLDFCDNCRSLSNFNQHQETDMLAYLSKHTPELTTKKYKAAGNLPGAEHIPVLKIN
ncbi:MADS-box transcription factor [Quillaja saponaria]|uniref:MADS-box transcription factor n=1 Tax=Quillaja saponaria TaxID=32244 RepID=A0AAD7VN05_QUISA|nr:MADS-box transcription factor [Quillaja saponaria]